MECTNMELWGMLPISLAVKLTGLIDPTHRHFCSASEWCHNYCKVTSIEKLKLNAILRCSDSQLRKR